MDRRQRLPGHGALRAGQPAFSSGGAAAPFVYYNFEGAGGLSEEAVESAKKAVRMVEAQYYYRGLLIASGHGAGFFISESHLITNFHVIGRLLIGPGISLSLKVQQYDLSANPVKRVKTQRVALKKVSALYDLALLETEEPAAHYLKISDSPSDLQSLFTAGFPGRGFAVMELQNPRFGGRYTLITDTKRNYDGDVFKGLSGGPVVNGKGHVVGVNFAGRERSGKDWLAINLQTVKKFLKGGGSALKCGESRSRCFYSELSSFCKKFAGKIGGDFKADFTYTNYCRHGRIKEPPETCALAFERLDRALDNYGQAAIKAKQAAPDYEEAGGAAQSLASGCQWGESASFGCKRAGGADPALDYESAYSSYVQSVRKWYNSECRFTY